jgi:hypothetical protein
LIHDIADMSDQGIRVSYRAAGPVFDSKVQLGQSQTPPHKAAIVVGKTS